MNGVPKVWRRDDECYFTKEMYPGIRVLMAHEVSSLTGDEAHMEKVRTHSAQFPEKKMR